MRDVLGVRPRPDFFRVGQVAQVLPVHRVFDFLAAAEPDCHFAQLDQAFDLLNGSALLRSLPEFGKIIRCNGRMLPLSGALVVEEMADFMCQRHLRMRCRARANRDLHRFIRWSPVIMVPAESPHRGFALYGDLWQLTITVNPGDGSQRIPTGIRHRAFARQFQAAINGNAGGFRFYWFGRLGWLDNWPLVVRKLPFPGERPFQAELVIGGAPLFGICAANEALERNLALIEGFQLIIGH